MQKMIALFIIITVSYLLFSYIFDSLKEKFVVGYNSIEIPSYSVPSLFDLETTELLSIFNNLFKDDINIIDYKQHSSYIWFPFETSIKMAIIDFLKLNINKFKNHKLELANKLENLYYTDIGNDRFFVFNANLVDNTQFMARNIKVKIKIKNIAQFLNDTISIERETNYKNNISEKQIIDSIAILSIRLDTNNYAIFKLNGMDKLEPNYYEIKNKLRLMYPFITSGTDILITKEMKNEFKKQHSNDIIS